MRAWVASLCLGVLLPGVRASGLPQQGFVWQRAWDADVAASVQVAANAKLTPYSERAFLVVARPCDDYTPAP